MAESGITDYDKLPSVVDGTDVDALRATLSIATERLCKAESRVDILSEKLEEAFLKQRKIDNKKKNESLINYYKRQIELGTCVLLSCQTIDDAIEEIQKCSKDQIKNLRNHKKEGNTHTVVIMDEENVSISLTEKRKLLGFKRVQNSML